jgi:hypothetical protein
MKKLVIAFTTFAIIASITSCRKKGCTDTSAINYDAEAKKEDGTCEWFMEHHLTFSFSHNYAGTPVSSSDFSDLKYTNAFGNIHSISKLMYLVSDLRLYTLDGDSVIIEGYQLINLSDPATLSYELDQQIPVGSYTGIGFNFGFDATDNITAAYPDLNVASWGWPMMLGGGYHNLQFEGNFITATSDTIGFGYHMGTARQIAGIDTTFHANHFLVQLPNSGFTLSQDATVEVQMDIAEWFNNPNTWDLNNYNAMLMTNYAAQGLMNANGASVFALGDITY